MIIMNQALSTPRLYILHETISEVNKITNNNKKLYTFLVII